MIISLISSTGCCGFTEAGILGRIIEENDTQDSQSIESESSEITAEETPDTEPTNIQESATDEATNTDSDKVTTSAESVTENTETKETTTNEPDTSLIHGVIPTKVTVNQDYGSGELQANLYCEFWNVGKLGGDYYSGANLTITTLKVPEGGDMSDPVNAFDGYFTGGPNGELILSDTETGYESHCYIKDGKELITPNGVTFPIDNPEAFDGWKN